MNAIKMLNELLKEKGYEGLYNAWHECGCVVDNLNNCGDGIEDDCCPGYKQDHTTNFHDIIGPEKE